MSGRGNGYMIEVQNLTKKYGDHAAVNDLSFKVEKGKIYGLLGVNGAGKSTTMNIITGYLAPTAGTVLIDGIDLQKHPEKAKAKIGYLPEIPPLYQDMTVEEYLLFAAELKGIKGKNEKGEASSVMGRTSLEDVSGRLIKNLSKGYKQRVGLAQALVGNPEILILDEPTVGLDPKQIIEIRELIESLKDEHTVILSSHILSEIAEVCDEIIIIAKGRLVACDKPSVLQTGLSGQTTVKVTVKGHVEAVMAAMEAIEGVNSVETDAKEELATTESAGATAENDCCVTYRITSASDVDIREALFFAMAELRTPILELSIEKVSLEKVFLELTDSEAESGDEEEDTRDAGIVDESEDACCEEVKSDDSDI